jgi:AraC-like DNA-binding protein
MHVTVGQIPARAKVEAVQAMVKTGRVPVDWDMRRAAAPAVEQVRFDNPRLTRVGVEVMTLAELRQSARARLQMPERLDFHLLLLIEAGRGRHLIDFVAHALRPGTVLLVRPGQVQRWQLNDGLRGQLVLISGDALAPSIARAERDMALLALDEWPPATAPSATLFAEVRRDVARLRDDVERFAGSEVESAIIRHALLALLLRLARELRAARAATTHSPQAQIHRLFVRELEASFHRRPSVLDLARRLGYSESTLSRACVASAGHSAKHAIDLRIALEAKRLLVHSPATVAQIGHQLGFSEPTNFVKFFRRLVAATPLAFRADAA